MTLKEILKKHTKNLAEILKTLTPSDYYVCSETLDEIAKEVAEDLGLKYIEDHCYVCGAKIYRLNVETKAKPICLKCALKKTLKFKGG